jgi:hypothetical protein
MPKTNDARTFNERFCAALSNIKAPPMNGRRHNSMGGGRYVLLPDLLDAVQPCLVAEGLFLAFDSALVDSVLTVTAAVIGSETSVRASSSCAVTSPGGRGQGATPHAIGSCTSYLKRYALGLVVPIGVDEDDDGNAGQEQASKPAPRQPKPPATDSQARAEAMGSIVKSGHLAGWLPTQVWKDISKDGWDSVRSAISDALKRDVPSLKALPLADLVAAAGLLKTERKQADFAAEMRALDPNEDIPL